MSVVNINNDELFNVVQHINLVRVKMGDEDFGKIYPVLYFCGGVLEVLVDSEKTINLISVEEKVILKFQSQEYEYIVIGKIKNKNLESPFSFSIELISATKFYNLRQFMRFDVAMDILLSTPVDENGSNFNNSKLKNISKGGIMAVSDLNFNQNSIVLVKIKFDPYDTLYAKTKIVRKSAINSQTYNYGLQFIDMSDENLSILNRQIFKLEKEYFRSVNNLRGYSKKNEESYCTKIAIFSDDPDESFGVRETLVKLGAENFEVLNNFNFYFDVLSEIAPQIIIVDVNFIDNNIKKIVKTINMSKNSNVIMLLPIKFSEEKLNNEFKNTIILFKPLIYNELEEVIIKYL